MRTWLLIALLAAAACSGDDADPMLTADAGDDAARGTPDAGMPDASDEDAAGSVVSVCPDALMLEGQAEAMNDEGARVMCTFFGMIAELECAPNGDVSGMFLGEIIRTTEVGDTGFEFAPFVGGPATITGTEGDAVELRFVGDQPDDALQFWLELEVIEGTRQPGHRYGGSWRCAPGVLDGPPGYMDVDLTAEGTWSLTP